MKRTFALLMFFVSAQLVGQQTITGTVVSQKDQQPIVNASIQEIPNGSATTSNAEGKFNLQVKSNNYTVVVSAYGYKTDTIQSSNSILSISLKSSDEILQPVEVSSIRASKETPVAYTNLDAADIQAKNNGQDIPLILDKTPSVVSTSDAGAGVGYTALRIRGSDQTRINVTVNGIPLNDPESHGVWWVNMPDFASTTNSIQIQRGVGTSTNGSGAFGASINMETKSLSQNAYGGIQLGGGSFNTQRFTATFGTGIINNRWTVDGRLSRLKSDGWVDRASSDLSSYYFAVGYQDKKNTVKAISFGGKERTYQSWNGIDSATFKTDPTFNSAGAIYDANWNVVDYYDNEVDNYNQDHYQLHWNHRINENLTFNVSSNLTYGRGYYEQYRQGDYLPDYNIDTIVAGTAYSDLIRQLWLDNYFYGGVASLNYYWGKGRTIFGGGFHRYEGDHFGNVIWARNAGDSELGDKFYDNQSLKDDWNVYVKTFYAFMDNKLKTYLDLQVRGIQYSGNGSSRFGPINFEDNLLFFNPKVGALYQLGEKNELFLSYAIANKEPNRDDYIFGEEKPQHENLQDIELGYRQYGDKISFEANAFFMYYTNQLVATGELSDVGEMIRENIGTSYRMGVELSFTYQPIKQLVWQANATVSDNVNIDYSWDENGGVGTPSIATKNTKIPFSAAIISNSDIGFYPSFIKGMEFHLISKYVGEQYVENTNIKNVYLPAFFVNDIRWAYTPELKSKTKISFFVDFKNIFSEEFASFGYYDPDWGFYFYPQAPVNTFFGLNLEF